MGTKSDRGQASTRGRQAIASRQPALAQRPAVGNHWSLGCWRLAAGAWSRPGDQTLIAGRRTPGDQRSLTGVVRLGPPAAGRCLTPIRLCAYFLDFLNFYKKYLGSLENGPGLLGEWVCSTPIFWSWPVPWKYKSLHFSWRLEILFFSKNFFS
jgi:hypothetical protein